MSQHYKTGTVEAIDLIEAYDLDFCLGNAVKYIARAGRKGDAVEDLEKAMWYLQRKINQLNDNKGTRSTGISREVSEVFQRAGQIYSAS